MATHTALCLGGAAPQVERTLPKPSAALAQRAAALTPHEAELDAELDEAAQASCAHVLCPCAMPLC